MKKKDLVIIGAALLAAAIVYLITALPRASGAYALIYVGGEVYQKLPLDEPAAITIDQGDGRVNVVVIDEAGVRMASSTCKNQICVLEGTLRPDEAEGLALGRWIVCLPNGVAVEIREDAP